jgi:hypothetical protein
MPKMPDSVETRPLTAKNWADLERLFGPRGACAGCWCMYYRRARSTWKEQKGEKNRRAFRKIVATGIPTGVLAYVGKEPAGWCAVAPRADYSALARSRVLRPVDERPVWSVTCFYVAKEHRRSGLTEPLLQSRGCVRAQAGSENCRRLSPRPALGRDAGCVCVDRVSISFSKCRL